MRAALQIFLQMALFKVFVILYYQSETLAFAITNRNNYKIMTENQTFYTLMLVGSQTDKA